MIDQITSQQSVQDAPDDEFLGWLKSTFGISWTDTSTGAEAAASSFAEYMQQAANIARHDADACAVSGRVVK